MQAQEGIEVVRLGNKWPVCGCNTYGLKIAARGAAAAGLRTFSVQPAAGGGDRGSSSKQARQLFKAALHLQH
jgi:hypothetical protein